MAATILIADDDAVQRRLVENMVQKCGYEPLVVDSGDDAVALLTAPDAQPIDAVVLDLVMPGLDGRALADRLRADRPELRVIFMSGYASGSINGDSLRARGTELIDKPFEGERLVAKVREVLKN